MGAPVSSVPENLAPGLSPGIANLGQARSRAFPYHVGFIIEFAEQWKDLKPNERERLLAEPWAFKDFTARIDFRGQLFRNRSNSHRPQREALLHLVHPDTFEGIVSVDDKGMIAKTFANLVKQPTGDVDRQLEQIRRNLGPEKMGVYDFWEPEIRSRWDENYKPDLWEEFVRQAQAYVDTGNLEKDEIDYKLVIGRKLAEAREAVLNGTDDWATPFKRGFADNLIVWQLQDDFYRWCDLNSKEALEALRALWAKSALPDAERIRAFTNRLPDSALSGRVGNSANVISVLLMGLDVEQYPPFRIRKFNNAYKLTGYDQPAKGADEAALYEHALGFLDRFIDEASKRGLNLRHRLDAQSVVWGVLDDRGDETSDDGGQTSDEVDQPTEDDEASRHEPDLPALAEETKARLGEYHSQRQALSRFVLGALVVSKPVLGTIRRKLRRMTPDVRITVEEIEATLREDVLKREVLEGENADAARKKVLREARQVARRKKANSPTTCGKPGQPGRPWTNRARPTGAEAIGVR